MQELDEADGVWHVRRAASRSFDDEFSSVLGGDLLLLQVSTLMLVPIVLWL